MNIVVRLAFFIVLLPVTVLGDDDLPASVRNVLKYRDIPDSDISIFVENLSSGERLLEWRDDEVRTPASVMKLVTTLVALDTLGPTYTWKTEVWFGGELHDGTLDGDLLLKGYGDPFLVTERLWLLQKQLRQAGVHDITGSLLLDDSYFDVGDYDPAAFDNEPLRAYNVEPNALMTNLKVVRFLFEANGDGRHVNVRLEPELDNVTIRNQLALVPGRCTGYRRGIAMTANAALNVITFSGRFPIGCTRYSLDRTVLRHNRYTYGLFKSLWQESGGKLLGGWKAAVAPEDTEPDLVFESLPLAEVISKVNKHSNNVMARQLLFTLGAESAGPPATEETGRGAVDAWLTSKHFDFSGMRLANGAGLSRDARVTARQLGRLLRYGFDSPFMPEYLGSLSLSGLDGTLARRFRDTAMRGMAHMKTGSLDHVSSIAGYVQARSGDRYSVVVLVNHEGSHRGPGEEIQEALLRWVREH